MLGAGLGLVRFVGERAGAHRDDDRGTGGQDRVRLPALAAFAPDDGRAGQDCLGGDAVQVVQRDPDAGGVDVEGRCEVGGGRLQLLLGGALGDTQLPNTLMPAAPS